MWIICITDRTRFGAPVRALAVAKRSQRPYGTMDLRRAREFPSRHAAERWARKHFKMRNRWLLTPFEHHRPATTEV